jgi:hypothetical protein
VIVVVVTQLIILIGRYYISPLRSHYFIFSRSGVSGDSLYQFGRYGLDGTFL